MEWVRDGDMHWRERERIFFTKNTTKAVRMKKKEDHLQNKTRNALENVSYTHKHIERERK